MHELRAVDRASSERGSAASLTRPPVIRICMETPDGPCCHCARESWPLDRVLEAVRGGVLNLCHDVVAALGIVVPISFQQGARSSLVGARGDRNRSRPVTDTR